MSNPYFTIGHSTRSLETFIPMLQENGVTLSMPNDWTADVHESVV